MFAAKRMGLIVCTLQEHSSKFNREFHKCCALISIRFWSSEQTIYEYNPRYQVNGGHWSCF